MRVMLLIQRFPPHHIGGYELRFADIAAGLRSAGHQVSVATSTFGLSAPVSESGNVHRVLTLVGEVVGWREIADLVRITWADGRRLRRAIQAERPDVILIGNFYGLSSGLWNVLRRSSARLVLDVSNEWLLDVASTHGNWFRVWERPSRSGVRRFVQRTLRGVLNRLPGGAVHTSFPGLGASAVYATAPHLVAQLVASGNLDGLEPSVCASGIDLSIFPFSPSDRPVSKLLYVGRLKAVKGVHTAIRALHNLDRDLSLTIIGVADDAAYESQLRSDAAALGPRVEFRPAVPRDQIASVFAEHDALLFPTEWDEPFSRLPLEAMACGLPVIATPTGGTPEAIEDGVTGLMFPPRDEQALAASVRRLAADDDLRQRIIGAGRRQVEDRFTLDAAVARVERVLSDAARAGVPA